jgi:hypothetical protein
MKYASAVAFRAALEQRLKQDADGDGARLMRLRKRVAYDRLLVRLEAVASGRWLLKGAYALDLRMGDRSRTTMDVDIEWQADADEAHEALLDASQHDAGDYFVFEVERTPRTPDQLGGSVRFNVLASLGGRLFERFVLDVGFRRKRSEPVERVALPDDLAFAGVGSAEIGAIPVELQIAEKLHAYTRTFGASRKSSRAKDLVDLVLIAQSLPVGAVELREAIDEIFAERGTHDKPSILPRPPAEWAPPYRAMAQAVGISPDLAEGYGSAAAFLDPVLQETVLVGAWRPEALAWTKA